MTSVSGGELVVRTLLKAGVDTIFSLNGAHIDTVFQACLDHALPIVDTRNEMAAGHAAEGYARAGQRMGVALVTAGGGFTNVMTSITNAWLDRTPVLYITGSGALRDSETNTLQAGIDQVAMARPVTKWAYRITATDQISRLLAQAVRIVNSGPRGPVLIDIPWDVLMNQIDETAAADAKPPWVSHGSIPHPADIEAALGILRAARRPVIIVGSEAVRSRAGADLAAFVAATGIPTFADYEALGLLSALGDANAGLIQGLYTFRANDAPPDAVLMLGSRFGLNTVHGSGLLIPLDATVVQIDPDARELGRLQNVALGITADVGGSLFALAAAARQTSWPNLDAWRARARSIVRGRFDLLEKNVGDDGPIHPFRAVAEVARQMTADHVVVADGALTYLWLSEVIGAAQPAAFLCHGYLGSMGVGMGTALGAQVAARKLGKRVVLVTGDGSVGYSLAEFDALVRHGLSVVVVVMNNRSWGATLHFQENVSGPDRITNNRLENGAYEDAARALGAEGYSVSSLDELREALEQALRRDVPACLNVRVGRASMPPEEAILFGKNPFQ